MDHTAKIDIPKKLIGKRYQGFTFDMYAWCKMSEITQLGFEEFDVLDSKKFMTKAVYCAALSYNKERGIKVNFSERDVHRWLSDMKKSNFDILNMAMLNSYIGGKTLKQWISMSSTEEGEEKKK